MFSVFAIAPFRIAVNVTTAASAQREIKFQTKFPSVFQTFVYMVAAIWLMH